MDNQKITPEQKQQIKKAKRTLWLGLGGIIIVGMAVAVYFIFLKDSTKIKPTPIDLDTSHWQSTTNEQYGFSLKFPMEWTLEKTAASCTAEELSAGTCSVDIMKLNFLSDYHIYISYQGTNAGQLPISEWLTTVKHQTESASYSLAYDKEKGITLTGLNPAVYQGTVDVYFTKGDNVFRIEWFDNNKRNEQVFQVFNKILLSIAFTGSAT